VAGDSTLSTDLGRDNFVVAVASPLAYWGHASLSHVQCPAGGLGLSAQSALSTIASTVQGERLVLCRVAALNSWTYTYVRKEDRSARCSVPLVHGETGASGSGRSVHRFRVPAHCGFRPLRDQGSKGASKRYYITSTRVRRPTQLDDFLARKATQKTLRGPSPHAVRGEDVL